MKLFLLIECVDRGLGRRGFYGKGETVKGGWGHKHDFDWFVVPLGLTLPCAICMTMTMRVPEPARSAHKT